MAAPQNPQRLSYRFVQGKIVHAAYTRETQGHLASSFIMLHYIRLLIDGALPHQTARAGRIAVTQATFTGR
jgi:hypothetical protein